MKEAEKTAFAVVGVILSFMLIGAAIMIPLANMKSCKNPDEFIEKIDSLDSKVDSIYVVRDSILEKIDTVYIKLEDNNKQYEENFNRVVNNDASEDYVFFLNYINSNRARLDSISNNL